MHALPSTLSRLAVVASCCAPHLLKQRSSRWRQEPTASRSGLARACGRAGGLHLKYVLLDASTKHAETLQQAHSVILTSGTLAPLDVLTQQLYRPADAARMHEFTCGHIVPPERVLAVGVGCGPGGRRLKLTHGLRDSQAVMDECGQLISNFCRIVPQGFVVFVPSFAYADALRSRCAAATRPLQQPVSSRSGSGASVTCDQCDVRGLSLSGLHRLRI